MAVRLKGPLEIVDSLTGMGSRVAHQAEVRMLVHPQERSRNQEEEAAGRGSTLREMRLGKENGD
jgi:hypothetical protein